MNRPAMSSAIACGGCGQNIPLAFSDALRADRGVDVCPVCAGSDFYTRKDFNPQVGLAVVIAGALVSAVFYWFKMDLVAYGVGAVMALACEGLYALRPSRSLRDQRQKD